MNILLVGSGGREHALAWKMAQSPKCSQLFIAPGNAGTSSVGTNVSLNTDDFAAVKDFVLSNAIDIVVVGPEIPLVAGFTDNFVTDSDLAKVTVIGPAKLGATLEGSKDFSKQFMMKYGIPTAGYCSVTADNLEEGVAFLKTMQAPYVLKADGLAAGKGVLIIDDIDEAVTELKSMLDGKFGSASATVVIEEFLSGVELSVFALTDGISYQILPEAKDYKRIGEGDTGLNTGGMGAISPVPFADEAYMQKIKETIVEPTIKGLQGENIPFIGFIFFGLINCDGTPKVIEYNVRMGDPETEAVMLRVKSDLVELFEAAGNGTLGEYKMEVEEEAAVTVMMVSGGYPEAYEKGKVITGFDKVEDSIVFHAGTADKNGAVVSAGGRVLAISSLGKDKDEALAKSFANAEKVKFEGAYYRKDLGFDL